MIRIGIGVEGPSDYIFWNKVLHRHFAGAGILFRVSVMHGRSKLIRGAAGLAAAFADTRCAAAFFLVDKDKDPCMGSIYHAFADDFRDRLRHRTGQLPCRLCVADRELESWFLADEEAMRKALGFAEYSAGASGGKIAGKGKLEKLLIEHASVGLAFNEIAFAKLIAGEFNPENAAKNSASFAYFWKALESVIRAAKGGVE